MRRPRVALPLAACGRDEPDLDQRQGAVRAEVRLLPHARPRRHRRAQTGPNLDTAFRAALGDGISRDTVEGIVHRQILHPRTQQRDAGRARQGPGRAATWPPTSATRPPARRGLRARWPRPAWPRRRRASRSSPRPAAPAATRSAKAGATGTIGPSLNDLRGRGHDSREGQAAEDYVRESIVDPDAFIVKGFQANVMPSFQGKLTDKQIQALVEYLLGS